MLQAFFHAWERRLASVTTDRVVRPFEWGLDWVPSTAGTGGDGSPYCTGDRPRFETKAAIW